MNIDSHQPSTVCKQFQYGGVMKPRRKQNEAVIQRELSDHM